ncbi:MAG: hypothetical protein UU40_C0005G0038 [Candidatus Uhrbacteria bacterium GW2011_GWD2_41_121]|uniref:Uncharacterized protein n=1 Tax=Candidatus Uhrbacteria bacterium GW2011_GWC1_41_20 TaxID=1618983 RepID=A0A0G0VIV0_9BACT|nr:MAG: hypothetical protein UT52_C0007G0038 [Candidatus Uhrbacteria bacterium GW2011_GWE1_39_46]KKR64174.1 MAG: hypothetical protein UU04_C0005G0038 [Candidatus Uhrbacteria bacterium GW2011_GWC2_40_450]KKR90046.1 MAG: hypothetical protein UU36_C0012G0006 [Candidatus Uhrbacteria bacterium GW2011_GWE2_41_1153]KKR90309.1 MAG: hypothetical protein UU40_C0005G0038 [Candidatus Uhrbacteria bacterium GW2011_GWD2_41_121]KKR95989.1 MAG: hypothetical protein UU46_C0010G0024 [Candidatus Uhrbacteria bacter
MTSGEVSRTHFRGTALLRCGVSSLAIIWGQADRTRRYRQTGPANTWQGSCPLRSMVDADGR